MILGTLFLLVPFGFGLLRLRATGDDLRYLVVAVASTLGALVVLVRPRVTSAPAISRMIVALVVAALGSAVASYFVGSRNAISLAVVSISFAMCSAVGAYLVARSRAF